MADALKDNPMKRVYACLVFCLFLAGPAQPAKAQAVDPALIRTFAGHSDDVNSVAFSPDGRHALTGSRDNTLKLWETASGRLVRTFKGHTAMVRSVAFSPDGRYALSGSGDKTFKLWEVATGKLIRTFAGHLDWVKSVVFSPDGRFALSGSVDKTLKLWEVSPWTKPADGPPVLPPVVAETPPLPDAPPPSVRP